MPRESTLFLINRMMPEKIEACSTHQQITMMDMNMLVMPGGRERTEQELTALLQAAAFQRTAIIPLRDVPGYTIIQAAPDHGYMANFSFLK